MLRFANEGLFYIFIPKHTRLINTNNHSCLMLYPLEQNLMVRFPKEVASPMPLYRQVGKVTYCSLVRNVYPETLCGFVITNLFNLSSRRHCSSRFSENFSLNIHFNISCSSPWFPDTSMLSDYRNLKRLVNSVRIFRKLISQLYKICKIARTDSNRSSRLPDVRDHPFPSDSHPPLN